MEDKVRMLIKLTNSIYRCTQGYIDKKLEKYNLTVGTYPYLLVLNRMGGISQNEISRELSVDKAMSARTIKKLIELGYIEKKENKEDIRAYKLYITEKAKEIIPEILEIIEEWIEILVQGNEKEKIEASIEFLENVLENGKKFKRNYCERMKRIEQDRKRNI
ncbi:MarR family winged helix-turn-helix transcriptional regulator [Clostridium thailandense]|uniref:Winged helix-turn-helix transcriptional regulator n=1 Tax=Clostridium thailandense TaxID=2794346 RepID=A0A949TX94_9CLOT|nr:MarR family winged helix-turn-helix transcriptional regulator [Clostridium thailandense]MBV7273235.1 winged helix-turn-helix transcriptional regulator [Clostridium thailandense]MCH5137968.1 winged helix-turn-helix transcriptional regulator [Clostridiaceae bacterium UIB06]